MTGLTLSAKKACDYAGCGSMAQFHDWVRRGILPRPIPGTHSYSKAEIDAYRGGGTDAQAKVEPTDPYQDWKRRQRAGAA